jgi:lysophospholipase L1-like esterase
MKQILAVILLALAAPQESSTEPAARKKEYSWMSVAAWNQRHEANVKRMKEGNVDLLFVGDSITEGWGNNSVWQKTYAPQKAANIGIGGDTTENVLWRVENGEVEGISPKVAVLLIGTNNFGLEGHAPDAVAKGVAAVVQALRKKLPSTKIILLAIFPRDEKPTADIRKKIKTVNDQIAKLDDRKAVHYLDLGPKLANPDGSLSKEIMPDFLHLSEKGYQIWADGMAPLLKKLMGD